MFESIDLSFYEKGKRPASVNARKVKAAKTPVVVTTSTTGVFRVHSDILSKLELDFGDFIAITKANAEGKRFIVNMTNKTDASGEQLGSLVSKANKEKVGVATNGLFSQAAAYGDLGGNKTTCKRFELGDIQYRLDTGKPYYELVYKDEVPVIKRHANRAVEANEVAAGTPLFNTL